MPRQKLYGEYTIESAALDIVIAFTAIDDGVEVLDAELVSVKFNGEEMIEQLGKDAKAAFADLVSEIEWENAE